MQLEFGAALKPVCLSPKNSGLTNLEQKQRRSGL